MSSQPTRLHRILGRITRVRLDRSKCLSESKQFIPDAFFSDVEQVVTCLTAEPKEGVRYVVEFTVSEQIGLQDLTDEDLNTRLLPQMFPLADPDEFSGSVLLRVCAPRKS